MEAKTVIYCYNKHFHSKELTHYPTHTFRLTRTTHPGCGHINSIHSWLRLNGTSKSPKGVLRFHASLILSLCGKHIKAQYATNCSFYSDWCIHDSEQFKIQSIADDILKQWRWEKCIKRWQRFAAAIESISTGSCETKWKYMNKCCQIFCLRLLVIDKGAAPW